MKNPFFNDETESYKVEEIYEWFVGDETTLSTLYKPKHHFICGDRGTGKSMLMRYLEPYCQFMSNGGWENFIKKEDAFLAFYVPIPKSIIDIDIFRSKDLPVPETIFAHYFNMLMTEAMVKTMKTQLAELPVDYDVQASFVDSFISLLSPLPDTIKTVNEKCDKIIDPLNWVLAFADNEKKIIMDYLNYFSLRRIEYTGSISNYHTFVLPFVKLIKRYYCFDKSIYILIDDAGNTFDFQQRTFNSWIANRDHNDLSIKISTVISYYKTFLTITGDFIDGKNDFQYIHLDNYGSKTERASASELKRIIDKRLDESGIHFDSDSFFQVSQDQKKEIERARLLLMESVKKNDAIIDKDRYISRYTMREYYKLMANNKKNPRNSICREYCGIEDIISFSSYNIRDCLKVCSSIFDYAYPNASELSADDIVPISPSVQSRIINKSSKAEIVSVTLYKEHYNPERIQELKTLIISLGNLFRKNLLNFEYSEGGVTAFQTQLSRLSKEEKEVIKIGIEQRYFLRRFYSDKDGSAINSAYALNKMFFPYFKLELAPFSGRIKIKPELIKLACMSSKDFEKEYFMLDGVTSFQQLSLFDNNEEIEDGIDDIKNNLSELF